MDVVDLADKALVRATLVGLQPADVEMDALFELWHLGLRRCVNNAKWNAEINELKTWLL